MKSRYGNMGNPDSVRMESRQSKLKAEHNANDAFVKREQMEQVKYAGRDPKMEERLQHFNAQMANTGENAQRLASEFGKSLDECFPVK